MSPFNLMARVTLDLVSTVALPRVFVKRDPLNIMLHKRQIVPCKKALGIIIELILLSAFRLQTRIVGKQIVHDFYAYGGD